ncbi:hypothetical protein D0864_08700 [Hortaea werneckii]|uniref:Uncharacterized protein n=1 Tax=Hortaea werneckii TaxID=91943 RepID=A0A3M7EV21_HORWE|nr:hypothetical protein D0864_08700 [Hortaea werneckii]
MHASELLWLFMPLEAGERLHIPQNRKVWGEVIELLKGMHLTELNITVSGRSCPRPCTAGERTATGCYSTAVNDDSSRNVSKNGITFAASDSEDHEIKREHPSTIEPSKVQQVAALSWNALESSTAGWHTCDTLAYDGQREQTWVGEGEQESRTYKTPIRQSRNARERDGVDEHVDTFGLF